MVARAWSAAQWIAVVLVAALSLAATPPHTHLSRSSPAAGDTLRQSPSEVRLWFSGRAELSFTRVRLVRRSDGREIALGPVARLDSSFSAFNVPVTTTVGNGTYTVVWQTAAADGHPVRGQYDFTIVGVAVIPMADTARIVPAHRVAAMPDEEGDELRDYQVARWAGFIGLLAVLGAVVFRFAVLGVMERRNEPVADLAERARQIGVAAVVLLLANAVYRLFTELRALGHERSPLDVGPLIALLSDTAWGRGWLVGGVGALLLLAGLVNARRLRVAWYVAGLGALAVAISPALTGHAAAEDNAALAVTVDALHVLGAGAWLGTLLLIVLAGLPAALRRVPGERGPAAASILRAFHRVALVCVPLVLLSGLISAWMRLNSLAALTSSRYGAYLLIKLALFLCVALIGAYNWRRMLPAMGDEAGARRIRRTASLELVVGAIVLAVTAALVVTPPPE